jgi:hypothetical protein
MKKLRSVVLDITIGLGLLMAMGLATGVWPGNGQGADIFGGQQNCSYRYYGFASCYGNTSGCALTFCFGSGTVRIYSGPISTTRPCGASDYSCGYVGGAFIPCLSGA